jgi:hypothetical protein
MKFKEVLKKTESMIKESVKINYIEGGQNESGGAIKIKYKDSMLNVILQREDDEEEFVYIIIVNYVVRMPVTSNENHILNSINDLNSRSAIVKTFLNEIEEDNKAIISFRVSMLMDKVISLDILEHITSNLIQSPRELKSEMNKRN